MAALFLLRATVSAEIIQRDSEGKVVENWIDTGDEYDPRSRVWYKNAMANTSKVWTEPYTFFSSGLPGMSVSAKASSNTVLGADVNIKELSEFTASIPNSSHGSAIIIDAAQHTIAYDQESVVTPGPEYSGVPLVEHIVDPALRSLNAKDASRTSAR